jgi:hypothetical protein
MCGESGGGFFALGDGARFGRGLRTGQPGSLVLGQNPGGPRPNLRRDQEPLGNPAPHSGLADPVLGGELRDGEGIIWGYSHGLVQIGQTPFDDVRLNL